jgi:hypothetical protein
VLEGLGGLSSPISCRSWIRCIGSGREGGKI